MKRLLVIFIAVTFLGAGVTTLMAQTAPATKTDTKSGKQKTTVTGKQKIIVNDEPDAKKPKTR